MTSTTRRLLCAAPLLALGVAVHAQAQQTMYKCYDERGHLELTDTNKRGCKALELPGFITTNPPPHNPPPPRTRQGSAPSPAMAPASFPRVGAAEQRARDDDRRAILAEELRAEQQKLVDLKNGFNNGEPARQPSEKDNNKYQQRVAQMRVDIARSEQNIEALKREIANVR
jgi:hypothetical protein